MADIPYFLAGLLFSYADVPISSVGSRSLYTKRVHMCPFSFRKRQSMSDHGVEIHCARCQNSCVFGNRIRHTLYGLCQTRIVIYGVRRIFSIWICVCRHQHMLWCKEDIHPICLRVGVWVSGILDQIPYPVCRWAGISRCLGDRQYRIQEM